MNLRKLLSTLLLVTVVCVAFTSVVFAADEKAESTLLVSEEQPLDVASGEITEDKEVAKAEVVATEEAVESGEAGKLEETKDASGSEALVEADEERPIGEEAVTSEKVEEKAGSEEAVEAKEEAKTEEAEEAKDEAKTEEAKEAKEVKTEEAEEAKDEVKTEEVVEDKSGDAKVESGDAQISGDAKAESGDAVLDSGDKAEDGKAKEEEKSNLPKDVTDEKWFAKYVEDAVDNGLMKVDEDGNFLPYNKATRKEAVEALSKFASKSGDAMENEAATEEEINREEVAVLVYEVAKSRGQGFDEDKLELLDFEDVLEISGKNYEAVAWCNENGIMQGRPGKIFGAKDIATRAELAAVLVRLEAALQ